MPYEAPETFRDKFKRKITKEPLVPIGCGVTDDSSHVLIVYFLLNLGLVLTSVALIKSISSWRAGDSKKAQVFMRYRVLGQGLTLAALMGGLLFYSNSPILEKLGMKGGKVNDITTEKEK
ncbi:hypothetical protein BKA69DRAFT_1128926 [Paraphysoderma sedebokerense]|nr:hypothetical protein BKA69DRAFT_1128926 [Paraphysoderma sedebokerense]